jgi:hypothetical protein
MLSFVEQLARAADPWQRLVSHSTTVSTALLFAHLGALVAGGGLALAADLATWRLRDAEPDERARHLAELARTHRPVVVALGLSFVSGGLLFLADVEAFASSLVFWSKMALIVLLLANGLLMTRLERTLHAGRADASAGAGDSLWRRRRASACASAILWYGVLLAGTALGSR